VGTEDSTGRAGVRFEVRAAVLTLWADIGTKPTSRNARCLVGFGGKADIGGFNVSFLALQ
jgi:hypothetical protein